MALSFALERCGLDLDAVTRLLKESIDSSAEVRDVTLVLRGVQTNVIEIELEAGDRYVLKLRPEEAKCAFANEAYQLRTLQQKAPFPVPRVFSHGPFEGHDFLLFEKLPGMDLRRARTAQGRREREQLERDWGRLLGKLHQSSTGPRFGEVLPGKPPGCRSWPELYSRLWQHRIERLLRSDRLPGPVLDAVSWVHSSLPRLLSADDVPRLIHGNLDPSRVLCEPTGEEDFGWRISGVTDPNLAYGSHELDLAMLELHRGLDESFLDGYRSEMPIDDGYELRKQVYILYANLEKVRTHGSAHHVLGAMDILERLLRQANG